MRNFEAKEKYPIVRVLLKRNMFTPRQHVGQGFVSRDAPGAFQALQQERLVFLELEEVIFSLT